MTNRQVHQRKQRLDAVFSRTSVLPPDDEALAHWARYLCVLVSGFLENSVREVLTEFARTRSDPAVARYVAADLSGLTNARATKIVELVARFGPDHRSAVERAIEGDMRDALDSVVANRNLIAHGGNVGLTLPVVRDYYARVVRAVEAIEEALPSVGTTAR